jgi:hypothetical protein
MSHFIKAFNVCDGGRRSCKYHKKKRTPQGFGYLVRNKKKLWDLDWSGYNYLRSGTKFKE